MITREQLEGTYSEGEALAIYNELKANGDFIGFCKRFMHNEDHHVARNALWGLTKANKTEIAQLQPLLDNLIDLSMTTGNASVRRLSLNIVERLTIREDKVRTDFLDFCLLHMTDINEYPGIQSLCMKLAFRMCAFFPELAGELKRTIEAMETDYYSPAVKSVRNKILNGKMK